MIFSDHALLRFVQRVLGVKDEGDAWAYIQKNKYKVYYELLRMINESDTLYERFSPQGAGETFKYLVNGDMLIVISPMKNVVITLYDIKVDLNERINSEKIRMYTRKIRRNNNERIKEESKKDKNNEDSKNLEAIIEHHEKELARLKVELKKSIGVSQRHALEAKKLRHENRDMMQEIMYGFKNF